MRITYRQLQKMLNALTDEQLNMDVTVECSIENECHAADLRICGKEHDSLEENHPVIYIPSKHLWRATDQDIEKEIQSWNNT